MKLAKAVLGAAVAGIALAGSTATRAEPPVYVTLKESLPCCYGGPQQVFYVFSVTNDLGGANKIYQFEAKAYPLGSGPTMGSDKGGRFG